MKTKSTAAPFALILALLWQIALPSTAMAQTGATAGVTVLQLSPPNQANSRVQVPVGERVTLVGPTDVNTSARWYKNEVLIPNQTTYVTHLVLPSVTAEDAGNDGVLSLPAQVAWANRIILSVGPTMEAGSKFINYSSRFKLSTGPEVQIGGFVVGGTEPKRVLIRAVGSSLRQFGLQGPLVTTPRIRLFGPNQQTITFPDGGVPRTPAYWSQVFGSAGAFPLTGNELPVISYDAGTLNPGAYTVHVSDETKSGGEVLVEIYELPR
ncbi:MAG: hypothetical protein JNN01_25310 [Opitutaceae bacterium]|nr:hypothetical protein [Opitutaceae bacterium]